MAEAPVEDAEAYEPTLSPEQHAAHADTAAMLSNPSLACPPSARLLSEVLQACAPALRLVPAAGGPGTARGVVAAQPLSAGAVLLEESCQYYLLARSPGCDTVRALEDEQGRLLGAHAPWAQVRTLSRTLTINPSGGGELRGAAASAAAAPPSPASPAEAAYALVSQLTCFGALASDIAAAADTFTPPLLPELPADLAGDPAQAVPRRAQLLHCISQCNGHSADLPPDCQWLRGILWPLLGRLEEEDRDRLFDDPTPFSSVTAQFAAAACLNHSCEPNCAMRTQWLEGEAAPRALIAAKRDLAAGEECTQSYLPLDIWEGDVTARRRELLLTYRFACTCARCRREEPRAGTPQDPLAGHFPLGAGLDAQPEVRRGGAMWTQ